MVPRTGSCEGRISIKPSLKSCNPLEPFGARAHLARTEHWSRNVTRMKRCLLCIFFAFQYRPKRHEAAKAAQKEPGAHALTLRLGAFSRIAR